MANKEVEPDYRLGICDLITHAHWGDRRHSQILSCQNWRPESGEAAAPPARCYKNGWCVQGAWHEGECSSTPYKRVQAPMSPEELVGRYLGDILRRPPHNHQDTGEHTDCPRCQFRPADSGVEAAAPVRPQDEEFQNSARQVMFRAGLLVCRETTARFVEGDSSSIAASIRANWWPALGSDPGVPRQLRFEEITDGGEQGPWPMKEIPPSIEALPVAYAFLLHAQNGTLEKALTAPPAPQAAAQVCLICKKPLAQSSADESDPSKCSFSHSAQAAAEAAPTRQQAQILAAIMDSLIAQNAPDSVSGYTIMDAVLPFLSAQTAGAEPPSAERYFYDAPWIYEEKFGAMWHGDNNKCVFAFAEALASSLRDTNTALQIEKDALRRDLTASVEALREQLAGANKENAAMQGIITDGDKENQQLEEDRKAIAEAVGYSDRQREETGESLVDCVRDLRARLEAAEREVKLYKPSTSIEIGGTI